MLAQRATLILVPGWTSSGEFVGVWEWVKPIVPTTREMLRQNLVLGNLEKVTDLAPFLKVSCEDRPPPVDRNST